jgi:hypothetical protein
MNWTEIIELFGSWKDKEQIEIPVSHLLGVSVNDMWQNFHPPTQTMLSLLAIDDTKQDTLTATGILLYSSHGNCDVYISASKTPDKILVTLTLQIKKDWKFSDTFSVVSETDLEYFTFTETEFLFSNESDGNRPAFFSFSGKLREAAFLEAFEPLGIHQGKIAGNVRLTDNIPVFHLSIPISFELAENFPVKESSIGLIMMRSWKDNGTVPYPTFYYIISAEIKFGLDGDAVWIPVSALSRNPAHDIIFRVKLTNLSNWALHKLESLIGIEEGNSPAALLGLHLEELIQLNEVRLSFNPSKSQILQSIAVDFSFGADKGIALPSKENALFELRDTQLRVTCQQPFTAQSNVFWGLTSDISLGSLDHRLSVGAIGRNQGNFIQVVSAQLPENSTLPMRTVWSHFTKQPADYFPDVTITDLDFVLQTAQNTWQLHGEVNVPWQLEWEEHSWDLSRLIFTFRKDLNGNYGAAIEAFGVLVDIPFQLMAVHPIDPALGWDFEGRLGGDIAGVDSSRLIPNLTESFGLNSSENVPQIWLRELTIQFNTKSGDFHFSAETTIESNIGVLNPSSFANIRMELDVKKDDENVRRLHALLLADLLIGGSNFEFALDVSKARKLAYAQWSAKTNEGLHLFHLIKLFDAEHDLTHFSSVADEMLTFTAVTFLYDHTETNQNTLAIGAKTAAGFTAFLVGKKDSNSEWSFLFGIEYDNPQNEKIPFKPERDALHFMNFKAAALVVATNDFSDFSLPELPHFATEGVTLESFLTGKKLQIDKGMYLLLDVAFKENQAPHIEALKKSLKSPELILRIGYDADLKSGIIEADLTDVRIGNDKGGLLLERVSLIITAPIITFILEAKATVTFNGYVISGAASINISPDQIEGGFAITGGKEGLRFPDLPDFVIHDLEFMLGEVFAIPGIEFGLKGTMDIGSRRGNEFGFMLEMVGDIPNPRYLQLNVTHVGFVPLLGLLFDSLKVKNEQQRALFFGAEHLELFWSEVQMALPDSTIIQPGFGVKAELNLFGFKLFGMLEIDEHDGIQGHFMMNPISIDILQITGNGTGLTIKQLRNPDTNALEDVQNFMPVQQIGETGVPHRVVVRPNGPVINLSSTTSPYVNGNFSVQLFDLVSTGGAIELKDDGFELDFNYSFGDIIGFNLASSLTMNGEFHANGGFYVGVVKPIKGEFLGVKFDFNVDLIFGTSLEIHLSNEQPKIIDVSFYVDLFGWMMDSGSNQKPIIFDKISELSPIMIDQLGGTILKNVEDIILFIFDQDEWLREHHAISRKEWLYRQNEKRKSYIKEVADSARIQAERLNEWNLHHAEITIRRERIRTDSIKTAGEMLTLGAQNLKSHQEEAQRILNQWNDKKKPLKPDIRTIAKDPHAEQRIADIAHWKSIISLHNPEDIRNRIHANAEAVIQEMRDRAQQTVQKHQKK